MPRTWHVSTWIDDSLDDRYYFSISVQHEIDCTTFHSLFSMFGKKMVFKFFKGWQVCDWLAKGSIMLGFMDLSCPRLFRHSNIGLVDNFEILIHKWSNTILFNIIYFNYDFLRVWFLWCTLLHSSLLYHCQKYKRINSLQPKFDIFSASD